MSGTSRRPVRLLMAALGGEGGGVLVDWITRAVVAGMTFDIGDPALRKKADAFKLECYTPAVQMYVDRLNG